NVPLIRRQLWHDLDIQKQVVQTSLWVFMGDFNVALNMKDVSSNSSSMNSAMNDFKECVANIEVLDVNCSGLHYTWTQKPKGRNGILKKLDLIMGNLEFLDKFHSTRVVFQPYRISDHSLAVLKFHSLASNKPKPFKFFNFLAHKSEFGEVERFLKQKAKVDWLEAEDTSSAYFHKTIKSKNHQGRIVSILDANDVEVTGLCVLVVFVTHYQQFLGTSKPCADRDVIDLFLNHVSADSNNNMVRDILMRKLR
ncbi:hypothetical protein Tco_1029610, partial [Tanacetum coccineum]